MNENHPIYKEWNYVIYWSWNRIWKIDEVYFQWEKWRFIIDGSWVYKEFEIIWIANDKEIEIYHLSNDLKSISEDLCYSDTKTYEYTQELEKIKDIIQKIENKIFYSR